MNTAQLLTKVLTKKAKGYRVKETTDEYVVVDGVLTLNKRKTVTKSVAPDVSAVKALIELSSSEQGLEEMSDEQLQAEKLRLLNVLKLCEGATDENINKETNND